MTEHKFWDTQPIPKDNKDKVIVGPMEESKEVRAEPYALPVGFEWCTLDMADDVHLMEAYTLLKDNYVEGAFQFDYSPEFLKWALMPPGFFKDWIVGVRQSSNQRLLAMITGIPVHIHVLECKMAMAEINFLCIHANLRSNRLAPVLVKELARRVNLTGRWQAIATAGVRLVKPIAVAHYWHRSLNPKKLIAVGFSHIPSGMTMSGIVRLNKTLEQPVTPGIVAMEPKHVPGVTKLLHTYLQTHKVWIEMDEVEVAHWFLPRQNVIYTYCVINNLGDVTDFCSFFNIPNSDKDYNHIKAAYSFYNVATTCSLQQLMNDALHFAAKEDFDVFNALDIMQNKDFLNHLKFKEGTGRLHYHLYNYAIPELQPNDIGIVLL
jgi:glycylpeptide N-tetradecanoyltransferase